MKRGSPKQYAIKSCATFRVMSPAKLASLLLISESLMRHLADCGTNYVKFVHDGRLIENPKDELKKIQRRVNFLLSQIETPDYLHSGVRFRSYITNAKRHKASSAAITLDVKTFYQSARSAEVFRFFHETLEWPRDVASIAKSLLTIDGHLPTGGNASPLLSYWAYKPMFDDIAALALDNGCEFSLYIDDMTMTGALACPNVLHQARKIVGQWRLKAHKSHYFRAGDPRVVTGVAQTLAGRELPYRRRHAIRQGQWSLAEARTDADRLKVLKPLIGRVCEAAQVDPATWQGRADALVAKRRRLESRLGAKGHVTPAEVSFETDASDGAPF